MKKIKVLQINKLYYPAVGGIERTVQNIAEGLNEQVDMSILVCQPKGAAASDKINGIPVRRCGSLGTLFSLPISPGILWELRKEAKEKDILQFHAPFPLGDLAYLCSGYKGKTVLYWHSDIVKQKRLMVLYRPIMKRFLKRVDAIIVGAEGIIRGSSYLEPYRDKCVIIPFAVKDTIEKKGREYLEHAVINDERRVRFLFVGRLVYYKGVDVLLKAFRLVKDAELVIIGTGSLEDELKAYAEEHNFAERVYFRGQVDDDELNKAFAESDVFVLPSVAKSEAFGLVQLEAMSYGKPVINTNLESGVPEISLNGVTGITVEPGDVNGLAKAMNRMIDDTEFRKSMGAAARKRLEQEYTLEVMLRRLMELYKKLLEDG